MESLKRLIYCLGYPHYDTFDARKKSNVANLVIWLEDRKIRELEIEERKPLRDCQSKEWNEELSKYFTRLGCSMKWQGINANNSISCINWLASTAVRMEYEDRASECIDMEVNCVEMRSPEVSEELSIEIAGLGNLVGIPKASNEPDHEYLRRISSRIRLLFTPNNVKALTNARHERKEDCIGSAQQLNEFFLEFDFADKIVQHIAVVLKMLYLVDFRDLQTELNALIVLGQEYTADPKTNTSLGKVGR